MSGGLFQGNQGVMEQDMGQGMDQGVNPLLCFLCHQVSYNPANYPTKANKHKSLMTFCFRRIGSLAFWPATILSVLGA